MLANIGDKVVFAFDGIHEYIGIVIIDVKYANMHSYLIDAAKLTPFSFIINARAIASDHMGDPQIHNIHKYNNTIGTWIYDKHILEVEPCGE